MAFLWLEGFEQFSGGNTVGERSVNQTQINRKYDDFSAGDIGDNARTETGHNSGTALRAGRTGQFGTLEKSFATDTAVYVSLSLRYDGLTSDPVRFLRFFDGSTEQASVIIDADGTVRFLRGSATVLEQTGTDVFPMDQWNQIEVYTLIHNTTGEWEVRLNGATILSGTGNTRGGTNDQVNGVQILFEDQDQGVGNAGRMAVDNYVLQDSDGALLVDDISSGSWYIEGLFPNGVGDSEDFTPTPGTGEDNYQDVDDVPADDDVAYVESGLDADEDLYGYTNLIELEGGFSISALQINSAVRDNGDEGEGLITLIKSGTTTDPDTPQDPLTTYRTLTRISELDPDTSIQWGESGVNAAQFGVRVSDP